MRLFAHFLNEHSRALRLREAVGGSESASESASELQSLKIEDAVHNNQRAF